MRTQSASSGITLVEVMVALAVLGIVMALAAPSLADMLNKQRMRAVAAEISTDLAYARAESGLRPQNVYVGFRKGNGVSCYTIQLFGSVGQCNCTLAEGQSCMNSNAPELKTMRLAQNSGVEFDANGTFPTNRRLLNFNSPQMTTSVPDFEVILKDRRGTKLRLYLNGMGRVVTCAPDNNFGGVPAC